MIREQIILRDNAIEQADLLMEYKHLFVKHPSHHYAFKDKGVVGGKRGEKDMKAAGGMGLMSIFTSLLAEPLSKTGSSRTSADHLTIELVLHLIRNLLSISPLNTFGSPEKSQYASQLHRELLIVLQEEMVLDVLVCVGQEVERRENSGYNLLLMEILSCLLRGQVGFLVLLLTSIPLVHLHSGLSLFFNSNHRIHPMLLVATPSSKCHPCRLPLPLSIRKRRRHPQLPNRMSCVQQSPPKQTHQVMIR